MLYGVIVLFQFQTALTGLCLQVQVFGLVLQGFTDIYKCLTEIVQADRA